MAHQINLTAAWKQVDEKIWERQFNWVAKIESGEEISLVFEMIEALPNTKLFLNGIEVGIFANECDYQQFNITEVIEQKNRIQVTSNDPLNSKSKWSRVYLEIRRSGDNLT